MRSLREYIQEAEEKGIAIGHFNISDSEGLKAVVEAATELKLPVIIGVSEGEREFIGIEEIAALIRVERKKGLPVFLNADHTYSVSNVKHAVDAGFDAVIADGAALPFEENVKLVKECVEYVRVHRPEMLVEGEIGFIGKSSTLLEIIPEGVSETTQTSPEDAEAFVEATGVDLLAPSVGNIHGMVRGGEPRLNIERIRAIRDRVKIPLVLHGASGNSNEDIRAAIDAGIRIVHINTELRVAYKQAIVAAVNADDIAPYKFMQGGVDEMKRVVTEKLKLFNKL